LTIPFLQRRLAIPFKPCNIVLMFDLSSYSPRVQAILALDGAGERLMPLASGTCSSAEAHQLLKGAKAADLFPGARAPEAAMAGLYLYFSCLEEAHTIAQDIEGPDGSYWHGILHRQEPDPGNAGYWFRRVGRHAIFADLRDAAEGLGYGGGSSWDPFAFIDACEEARRSPGSDREVLIKKVQRAEWQLLFDSCAKATMRQ
jgi:hypothetical protein